MKAFSMLLALCAGNSSVTGEFPSQKDSNTDFDVSADFGVGPHTLLQTVEWPVIRDYVHVTSP